MRPLVMQVHRKPVACCRVLARRDCRASGFGAFIARWVWLAPVHGGLAFERDKGIRWMPWHQEAMKDVARCEKPRGAASRL